MIGANPGRLAGVRCERAGTSIVFALWKESERFAADADLVALPLNSANRCARLGRDAEVQTRPEEQVSRTPEPLREGVDYSRWDSHDCQRMGALSGRSETFARSPRKDHEVRILTPDQADAVMRGDVVDAGSVGVVVSVVLPAGPLGAAVVNYTDEHGALHSTLLPPASAVRLKAGSRLVVPAIDVGGTHRVLGAG
jgi:hypothetical protein